MGFRGGSAFGDAADGDGGERGDGVWSPSAGEQELRGPLRTHRMPPVPRPEGVQVPGLGNILVRPCEETGRSSF